MLVLLFNNMPALAADSGSGVVKFSGPANVVPGQTYTYIYKFIVRGAACGNANIVVGGAFEKVSGGENLFYDTIPNNTDGEISATITVRVKPDAAIGSTGTISVNEDESKCSKLVRDDSGNLDQVITNVTGKITATVVPATPSTPKVSSTGDGLLVQWNAVSGASGYEV